MDLSCLGGVSGVLLSGIFIFLGICLNIKYPYGEYLIFGALTILIGVPVMHFSLGKTISAIKQSQKNTKSESKKIKRNSQNA